jgi:hypothetical protein
MMVQVGCLQNWRQLFVSDDTRLRNYNKAIMSESEMERLDSYIKHFIDITIR